MGAEGKLQRGDITGLRAPGMDPGNLVPDPELLTAMRRLHPEDPVRWPTALAEFETPPSRQKNKQDKQTTQIFSKEISCIGGEIKT